MVTLWLAAYDVPCDGSPYVAGTFNGWSATDNEMTYDYYHDEYWVDLYLAPGSYEYKFVCYNWSDQETVPEECNDGNGDEFSNRLVVVPEDEEWIEADLTSWSGCPEPDPCDIVDCSNLHFAGVMEPGLINHISGELGFTADSVASLIQLGEVSMGVYSTWGDPDTATYMPEFSDPQDSIFLYLVEYPDGIPDTAVYYYWWWSVDAYDLYGDEFGLSLIHI